MLYFWRIFFYFRTIFWQKKLYEYDENLFNFIKLILLKTEWLAVSTVIWIARIRFQVRPTPEIL